MPVHAGLGPNDVLLAQLWLLDQDLAVLEDGHSATGDYVDAAEDCAAAVEMAVSMGVEGVLAAARSESTRRAIAWAFSGPAVFSKPMPLARNATPDTAKKAVQVLIVRILHYQTQAS